MVVQLTPNILNTDISRNPLISKNTVWTQFLFSAGLYETIESYHCHSDISVMIGMGHTLLLLLLFNVHLT